MSAQEVFQNLINIEEIRGAVTLSFGSFEMLKKEDPEKQVKFSSEGEFITSDFVYLSNQKTKYGDYVIINIERNVR